MSAEMTKLAARLWLLLVLAGCSTVAEPYRIVGYVHHRADMYSIGAQKLTHINYAFGEVSEQGEVVFYNRDAPAHLAQLQALKARNPKLKLILSIGGWGADNFSIAAFSNFTRERFAASADAMIRRYALDGIDLDWEYPGQPGPGIKYLEEDKQNFTLLLQTLRRHLDALSDARKRTGQDRYTLTIATAGGPYFQHTEMDRLHVYLDWINIMTYDFAGEWSKSTAHHAGMNVSTDAAQPVPSMAQFVEQHLGAGIPPRKLVIGVPFYARAWCGVATRTNNGLHQEVEAYISSIPYSTLRRQYLNDPAFTRFWDPVARAPYLWSQTSGVFISYEDPQSLREKVNYVKQHQLGGVMYWEQSEDPEEVLLDELVKGLGASSEF